MSVPAVLNLSTKQIPAQPYITWPASTLVAGENKKFGLVWAGRSTHTNDHNRSMKLSDFESLAELPGVDFHSLQKGAAALEAIEPPAGMSLVNHAKSLHDFTDAASIINSLDAVIAVDTAIAQLAGAMGKIVYLLLPFAPDWRWMHRSHTTPWYPTMRIFRQPTWGDWKSVIAELKKSMKP